MYHAECGILSQICACNTSGFMIKRLYLSLRRIQKSPVVGFQLVQLIKLQTDVLNRQLQHIPESSQILRHGPRVGVWVLSEETKFIHKTSVLLEWVT